MRRLLLTTAILLVGVVANAKTVDLGVGTVRIPRACLNEFGNGFDSLIGKIECPGGLRIDYDIGLEAGCYCDEGCDPTKKKHPGFTFGSTESELHAISVCLQSYDDEDVLIANLGQANFWARVKSKEHASTFLLIVGSFEYKSGPKHE